MGEVSRVVELEKLVKPVCVLVKPVCVDVGRVLYNNHSLSLSLSHSLPLSLSLCLQLTVLILYTVSLYGDVLSTHTHTPTLDR